jgi:hypothetical protein
VTKQVIVFPDIEGLLIARLNARYAATAAYSTVRANMIVPADPKPDRFTRLYRVGGSRPNLVTERATVLVEAYAKTTVIAQQLAAFTQAELLAVDEINGVSMYDPDIFSGLANLPDPTVPDYERYTFTYSVGARGTAL